MKLSPIRGSFLFIELFSLWSCSSYAAFGHDGLFWLLFDNLLPVSTGVDLDASIDPLDLSSGGIAVSLINFITLMFAQVIAQ